MQNSAPITEQEIQQLETWLHSPKFQGRAMQIDRLQGFLAAVASSPDTIPPSVWVPEAVGGEPNYDSMEQAQEFMGLLMRYYNSVVAELFSSQPLTLRARAESAPALRPDYQSWCEGYIAGWSLSREEWLRPGNGALKKLTFPILYLSGAFSEAQARDGKPYFADADQQQIEQDCIASLPQAVTDIFHFWLERRGTDTIRRETPKVGRNEACPCGSGKKFKQCCGTERTLH